MSNRPQHEQVFENKVRRVEKALISLGKTRGAMSEEVVKRTRERVARKVTEAFARLDTASPDLFTVEKVLNDPGPEQAWPFREFSRPQGPSDG